MENKRQQIACLPITEPVIIPASVADRVRRGPSSRIRVIIPPAEADETGIRGTQAACETR